MEGVDFGAGADASGDDELAGGEGAERAGSLGGEALQRAFGIDVGVEKGAAEWVERGDGLGGGDVDLFAPAADGDFAGFCIDACDELVCADACSDDGGCVYVDAFGMKEG